MVVVEELEDISSEIGLEVSGPEDTRGVAVLNEKSNGCIGGGGELGPGGRDKSSSPDRKKTKKRKKGNARRRGEENAGGHGPEDDTQGVEAGGDGENTAVISSNAEGVASLDANDFMSEDFLVAWEGFASNDEEAEEDEEEDDDDSEDVDDFTLFDANDLMVRRFMTLKGSTAGDDEDEEESEDDDEEDSGDNEEEGDDDEDNTIESSEDDNEEDSGDDEEEEDSNEGNADKSGDDGDVSRLDADDFMSGGFMNLKGFRAGVDDEDGGDEEEGDDDEEDEDDGEENADKSGSGGDVSRLDADDFMSGGFMNLKGFREGAKDKDEEEDDEEDNNQDDDEEQQNSDDEEANAKTMDLKGLAETDPEFFEFLQKEEPALLDFDPMVDSDDDEEDEEETGEKGDGDGVVVGHAAAFLKEQKASRTGGSGGITVTMDLLRAMQREAFERVTSKGVRRLVKAFRCACHLGDDEKTLGKFVIPSSEVYNELMVCALEGLQGAILRLIFPDKEALLVDRSAESDKDGTSNGRGEDQGSGKKRSSKKRRRKDESGDDSGDVDGVFDKGMGDKTGGARKKMKNGKRVGEDKTGGSYGGLERAGTGDSSSSGGVAEKSSRLVLTKEDFRKAALLPAWKPMQPTLYSFFKSLLHVMGELHDRTLLTFILSRLERYVPFLVPFPGLARALLKALLELWGDSGGSSNGSKGKASASEDGGAEGEHAERVRLLAYLRVRQMAEALPFPSIESCMKGLYLAFAKRARAPPATQEGKTSLRVMEGCVVELYGMDVASAYQNAFLYIRQLSLLLRRALQQKTKDSVQAVRKWQVVTCLRVWTGVLAAAPAENELRMLVFPLAQVIGGILRLCTTLRHSPLLFQLVRMRQRLASAAELYVPCSTPLLEVLRSPILVKAAASTGAPPIIPSMLRLGKTQVLEGRAQGAVVEEALRLLGQEMGLYRYSTAFPEMVIPVLGHLRRFVKSTKVSKWRMMVRGLMETLEARGTWAAKRRLELRLNPAEAVGLEVLRPKGAPTMRERLGASEAAVDRIDDEIQSSSDSKGKAAGNKRQRDDDDEEEHDESDSSSTDGFNAGGSSASRGVLGRNKMASSSTTAADEEGEISDPDLVEELGAWGDDDWD